MNNSIFEGKNCLVTGATGGLGKAICKQLSERGCNIFLTSKTRSKLVQLKKNLSKHKGIKIEFENGDLTGSFCLLHPNAISVSKQRVISIYLILLR